MSDENALDEIRASFPSTPMDASDAAVAAWLDAVADWFDQLIGFVPPKTRAIVVVYVLLTAVSTVVGGLVINRISKALDDEREAPAIAKKNELEGRRHDELDQKLDRLFKRFEDFAARKQFPARIVKRAPVQAEPNSNSKRLRRLELERRFRCCRAKAIGMRSNTAMETWVGC